ncbi:MAG TPA: hypothetical protein VMF04_06290 [Thermoplasmata archaeon]|nr:hypothetical protein [Thermoplasmata archaeon]
MRALTDSEARVIAVLLAARPDRERERLHQVGIPRSTYHAVRRRAYEEGWLRDRYIPNPVPLGRPFVTFLIVRPYADRFPDFSRTVTAAEGNVVLWNGAQIAVAVFFHRTAKDGAKLAERIEKEKLAGAPIVTVVPADAPTVPVYFDFEGLWGHLAGLDGTLAYPHGLGGPSEEPAEDDGAARPPLTAHQTWAMNELLRRPFTAAEQGRGGHLVGPFGLPFSQRRMLAKGWITHRTLLEPARLPPYQGRTADQVVLISGSPKASARPEQLFATLTRDCRVYPFLFVVGSDRWILGALGGAGPSGAAAGDRRPVLPTLRESLEGIEILQEPASGFTSPVDHRYESLLPPRDGAATAKS